jgi:hypothetical protein
MRARIRACSNSNPRAHRRFFREETSPAPRNETEVVGEPEVVKVRRAIVRVDGDVRVMQGAGLMRPCIARAFRS